MMCEDKKYVWYACYGSNLLRDRFYAYIRGGSFKNLGIEEIGCRDKALPVEESTFVIGNRLYFSGKFKKWENKGCAFIDIKSDSNLKTLCKLYLISQEQFCDVVRQENKLSNSFNISIPKNIDKEGYILIPDSIYGRILYLGNKKNFPIYSFTNLNEYNKDLQTLPSDLYLKVLIEGLVETFKVDTSFAESYFKKRM